MTEIKEFNLIDVKKNSRIINQLNNVYKLWGYEEISPSFINKLETIKAREVIKEDEIVGIVSNNSLCLRPEMTTSIVKLTSTRLINKKRPIRLFNNGVIFDKKKNYKNTFKIQEKLQSGIEQLQSGIVWNDSPGSTFSSSSPKVKQICHVFFKKSFGIKQ